MDKDIEKLQNEVNEIANQIEKLCKTDTELEKLYMGVTVYMSPLIQNSELLFLGINPGAGSYKHGNIKLHRIEPLDKSEYETEEYDLQNEWITIFGPKERINNIELLYKSVKTNCCFFATEDTQKLQKLKSRLLYKYKINISEKEKKWIKTILNYVNPRIIICEGFGAFNSLKNINEKLPVLGFKRIYSRFADIEDTVDTIKDALDGKI